MLQSVLDYVRSLLIYWQKLMTFGLINHHSLYNASTAHPLVLSSISKPGIALYPYQQRSSLISISYATTIICYKIYAGRCESGVGSGEEGWEERERGESMPTYPSD